MGQPKPLFAYFCFFQQQFFRKIVDLIRIQTEIVRLVGKQADNLTTTTAHSRQNVIFDKLDSTPFGGLGTSSKRIKRNSVGEVSIVAAKKRSFLPRHRGSQKRHLVIFLRKLFFPSLSFLSLAMNHYTEKWQR